MEGRTEETNGSRSFEERVFARFDAIDNRFDSLEKRIVNIESKQYDTKPFWERALAAIHETNIAMNKGFDEFRNEMNATRNEIGELKIQVEGNREDLKRFSEDLRIELDDGLRRLGRKFDVLNENILELQADHRYVDRRLEKVEAQLKPS